VQENPELAQRRSYIPMQNTTGRCKRIIQLNECTVTYHQVRDLIKNKQMEGQIVRKISVEAEVRVQ
jgi:hypothetical protein